MVTTKEIRIKKLSL